MTFYFITSGNSINRTTPGDAITLSTGDSIHIAEGGFVASTSAPDSAIQLNAGSTGVRVVVEGLASGDVAIYGAGLVTSNTFQVNGSVYGGQAAILVVGSSNSVVIGPSGYATGSQAVTLSEGANKLANGGSIVGTAYGAIYIHGSGSVVQNSGDMISLAGDMSLRGDNMLFSNTGLVQGNLLADSFGGAAGAKIVNAGDWMGNLTIDTGTTPSADSIINSGRIHGDISLGGANDAIRNSGALDGTVMLGDGDDLFDTRTGEMTGTANLGLGNDTFLGGDLGEVVFGDDGADILKGGDGDDELDGGLLGDVIRGQDGDDMLLGGDNFDKLYGGRGDDTLNGGPSTDTLTGGAGDDVLIGDSRTDTFVFKPGFGHDVVTDFDPIAGTHHDVVKFSGSLFASFSAVQAAMSQVGSEVVIKVGVSDSLTLENVALADLTADDFGFAI